MKPALGWAGLSRSALKRAEAQLLADSEGVRDEVGVLALHTAYANRFFPGTSVQQTRLRYALFVPWQIMTLLRDRGRIQSGQARRALEQVELTLARRLPDVDGEGTIGRRTAKAGRSVAIPPSQSYWVALGAWGILGTSPDGDAPSRRDLFARWGSWSEGHLGRPATDDEGRALETARSLFHQGLPKPPADFHRDKSLDFELLTREREFLRERLLDTRRPGDADPPSCRRWCDQGAASGTIRLPGRHPYAGTRTRPTERRCFGPVTLRHWRRSRGPSMPPQWRHAENAMMARPLGSDTEIILPRSLTSMAAPLSGCVFVTSSSTTCSSETLSKCSRLSSSGCRKTATTLWTRPYSIH